MTGTILTDAHGGTIECRGETRSSRTGQSGVVIILSCYHLNCPHFWTIWWKRMPLKLNIPNMQKGKQSVPWVSEECIKKNHGQLTICVLICSWSLSTMKMGLCIAKFISYMKLASNGSSLSIIFYGCWIVVSSLYSSTETNSGLAAFNSRLNSMDQHLLTAVACRHCRYNLAQRNIPQNRCEFM